MKNYYSLILSCFAILFLINDLYSQEENSREKAIKIFYDCNFCDEQFIKNELTYVNYVRDPKEAQVHVLITEEYNGGGGEKFTFFFIGVNEFKGQNDTLSFSTLPDATQEDTRQQQLNILKMGLMRYVAKTPLATKIKITYEADKEEEVIVDKWNSWVFSTSLNGFFNWEKLYKYSNFYTYIAISRITPELKFETSLGADFEKSEFTIDNSVDISKSNSKYFSNTLVKSINDHWSAGYTLGLSSSTYSNYDFLSNIGPAVEYNIFPYSESSRRQVRFLYTIGASYADYIDTTLYNKTKEYLYSHRLTIATEFTEKWGSISFSLRGSHYFHDFSFNRLSISSSLNLRIFKGLSLRLYGGASLIHDQLNLRKENATDADIYLRRKELASQYRFYGSVGLTYTFGSIYNNVVNPRFGN